MTAPDIVIYVRHSAACKHSDEAYRKCNCRKWLRWTHQGKRYREMAGTRSWAEAEERKREIQDRLTGRVVPVATENVLSRAVDVFLQDKKVQGVTEGVQAKYTRELGRLCAFAHRLNVYTVQGLTRELLTGYCATFDRYPSSQTRAAVRARTRGFLRYAYEAQWIPRIPQLPKMRVDEPPTMPLSDDEYERLLSAAGIFKPDRAAQVRALFSLMRWSGLAVRDALTLPRSSLVAADGFSSIVTRRQKTGTNVSVPIPGIVAKHLLDVSGPEYIFWDGRSDIVKSWTKYFIAPAFREARILKAGNMMSHRLRDTFAVSLLSKGVPLGEVSKLLGHESIKTTEQSYAKWVKSRQDRLNELVIQTWNGETI